MVGPDFSAAFNRVNHKALLFKLLLLRVGGPFLSILTEFLSNRLQRVVVDGQFNDYRNVISGVHHFSSFFGCCSVYGTPAVAQVSGFVPYTELLLFKG